MFAPTNAAFSGLAPEVLQKISNSDAILSDVLTNHVVSGIKDASQLLAAGSENTLSSGQTVTITEQNGSVFVDQSKVVKANMMATDGIVHQVDYVIIPNKAEFKTTVVELASIGSNDLRTLSTLLIAANLTQPLSDPTSKLVVLAPNDAAFAASLDAEMTQLLLLSKNREVLQKILSFHVIVGDNTLPDGNLTTLEGSSLTIKTLQDADVTREVEVGGQVVSNLTGTVVATEPVDNARVFYINRVLIPPGVDLDSLKATSSEGLSTTSIILIVLGGLACLTIVGIVVALGLRNKKRRSGDYEAADEGYDMKN